MQTSVPRVATPGVATALTAALTLALLAPWGAAQAQLGNLLNQGGSGGANSGGSAQGALGNLGGLGNPLSAPSLTSNSLGNVTGVLQYCIKNNYLNADAASSVKDSLLSKLPGGANTTDSGYTQGTGGILTAGNGQKLDLTGGGLKEEAAKQVCDKILSQAKSML
ncbi:DUF2501 domain-containing protein [Paraburkholderia silvatlantica]|uniref:Uncharacterized protein DUF2501 n=1 Tax=Paraburkholderia silvatlantica TaxID=321895 RepID=A0A2U1A8M6_9BURK|nr:DUF2501 domain-containing protein [Paraburkholderia silvatlantica]MBB2929136.1 hypothetical protein [Paraburkholderia silvatlantica]PVY29231.1 uncharacterized protein DUF2501 [Paraburkholderia silvatlantica]PXW36706.1 uncharacterized protein DUF2501 [Paraburkholderia silvatlantica]PYE22190.1 uncharacterized protein DUF2501 [Paraburkholderia silvatlantica]TDQ99094.1 uncharacterized protein DUF2501 [Paraburkholderia silvatlantica]